MNEYINGVSGAPAAVGPYSQAVRAGDLVFLSGQIGLDPATGKLVEGGVEAQLKQVLANIRAVLSHLQLDFTHIAKTTIFVTDLSCFQSVNKLYGETLGSAKPARSTVQVAGLPLGAQVEVEVIARLK